MVNSQYFLLRAFRRPKTKNIGIFLVRLLPSLWFVPVLRIHNAFDLLEDEGYIEELAPEEVECFKKNILDDTEGTLTPCGMYADTDFGFDAFEEERESRRRFYIPFFITTLISLISLVVAIAALLVNTDCSFIARLCGL